MLNTVGKGAAKSYHVAGVLVDNIIRKIQCATRFKDGTWSEKIVVQNKPRDGYYVVHELWELLAKHANDLGEIKTEIKEAMTLTLS